MLGLPSIGARDGGWRMADGGFRLSGIRLRARAAISGLVCSLVLFPPSVTSQVPLTHEDGQLKRQSGDPALPGDAQSENFSNGAERHLYHCL